jgi:hypothetical protein
MLPQPTTLRILNTTFAPRYFTETRAYYPKAAEYYNEPKYYSAPSYTTATEAAKYYVAPTYYTAAAPCTTLNRNTTPRLEFTTQQPTLHLATTSKTSSTTPKRPCITQPRTLPSLLHRGTEGLLCSKLLQNRGSCYYTTKAPEYYTTTYAAPSFYTEAPKYYTTKAPEYYTTTYAAPTYYTEAPKSYSAPSYYTTKKPEHHNLRFFSLLQGGSKILEPKFQFYLFVFRFFGHILIITSHWELIVDVK